MSDVTRPLAIVFYESLLPGSKVLNRLTDLGYRTQAVQQASLLADAVRRQKPLVVIADLALRQGDLNGVIRQLKESPETGHVPILCFAAGREKHRGDGAIAAGANLVAADTGIIDQLPQLLDHVLALD